MGLFKYSRGTKLRMSLDRFEGWAGIVGFRDIVFQFLGTFSSAIDLIAISPHELIKFSWDTLRQEFPCLHPVQLNHILTHYILPKGLEGNNILWAPSEEDSRQIENKEMLHESFESHPDFYLPITGYSLDLNCQLQEDHLLQDFAMSLQEKLIKRKRTSSVDSPARHSQSPLAKRKTSKPSLDVSDI
ncbi:PREDICTED: ras-associating and dilute domain-containing protein-like, partial [Amphimedon queenslandica]|uniref:Dilute domain-containing protein n=2 Tax=Amphimedon queenslandica TaxID=400682 RepID=A0AAN0IU48_AMPQE